MVSVKHVDRSGALTPRHALVVMTTAVWPDSKPQLTVGVGLGTLDAIDRRLEDWMRLFVALDLPGSVREQLARLMGTLQGARWIAPENYHITLRFIGETPNYVAEEIDLVLAAIKARGFSVEVSGFGTFERQGRPTSLWARVAPNPALDHLQGKVDTALRRAGLGGERRRFYPHISLARVDQVASPALAQWLVAHNLLRSLPVEVQHFTLFSSALGKEQSVYTPEVDYALA